MNNICVLGETMEESYVIQNMLQVVPSKFIQLASTNEKLGDLNSVTFGEVVGRLKAHEIQIKVHQEPVEKKLLLTHEELSERVKKKSNKFQSK